MVQLARALYGDPVRVSSREMRFKPNESFSLNLETESWYDHQEGEGGGFGLLYKLVHGYLPGEGNGREQPRPHPRPHPRPTNGGDHTPKKPKEGWQPMVPPPAGCGPPTDEQLRCDVLYEYRDANDRLLFYQRRWEARDGRRKQFSPLTYGRLWHGELYVDGWHARGPDAPRPLYRLNALSHAAPDAAILLCEGEKAADAAQRLFPDMVAMCWPNGSSSVEHADFGPIQDRDVIIWPDADQGGIKAAQELREKLPRARTINTQGLPDGYDAADLEAEGVADHDAWLRARLPRQDPYDSHQLPEVEWIDRRISDWDENELPERLWIVPDWIPREQVTGLYGPPGVNKTDFLIHLMMALSAGLVFVGYPLARVPVFGLFCEDTEVEIARRASRIARHYGMTLQDFPDFHYASLVGYGHLEFVTFDGNSMFESRALKRFDKTIVETGAAFACLDTAPHFFGGSEIDRRQVSRFLRKLDAISIKRGCGILITAHPSAKGRQSGRMDSGSTGWEGGVRARIALTRPEVDVGDTSKPPEDTEDRLLTLWKSNYAPPGKMLDLVCRRGVFTTAALDPEKAKARGPTADQACEEKFLELLRKTAEQGFSVNDMPQAGEERYAPEAFARRPDGKAFSKYQYKRAMSRLKAQGKLGLSYNKERRRNELVEITTQDG